MATIYDVNTNKLIEMAAEELKKVETIKAPEWAVFAKTGVHKERPPVDQDWWYMRAAAVLRSVYKLGPIGVSKLRYKYGGRKNRGYKPEKFFRGSGNILRKVLQQLEKAELVRQTEVGNYKGRIITPKGKSFLDKIASGIYVKAPKKAEKVAKAEVPEVKEEASVKVEAPKVEEKKEAPKVDKKVSEVKEEAKVEAPKVEEKKEAPKIDKKVPEVKEEAKVEAPVKEETSEKAETPKQNE